MQRDEILERPDLLRAAAGDLAAALDAAGDRSDRDEDDRDEEARGEDARDEDAAGAREPAAAQRRRIADALLIVCQDLREHNRRAEADDGLLPQVVHDAPWLAPRVEAMVREHDVLLADCERLHAGLADTSLDQVRRAARDVIRRIDAHRHRGTELLLDTYELDISAGD